MGTIVRNDIIYGGGGGSTIVDTETLNKNSMNPVANRVVTAAINNLNNRIGIKDVDFISISTSNQVGDGNLYASNWIEVEIPEGYKILSVEWLGFASVAGNDLPSIMIKDNQIQLISNSAANVVDSPRFRILYGKF